MKFFGWLPVASDTQVAIANSPQLAVPSYFGSFPSCTLTVAPNICFKMANVCFFINRRVE